MCGEYGDGKKPNCSGSNICKRQYGSQAWPNGFAFRYQVNGVLPGSDQATMEAAFERAWSKWARLCPYTFQKANGNANVTISVVGANDQFFLQNPQTQAYANIGPSGGEQSYVRFKGPAFGQWTPSAIHTLFLHEFGHVLGLSHANDPNSIMSPFISNMFSERDLTNDDVVRMQGVLSSSGISSPNNGQLQNNNNNVPQNNGQNYQQQPNQNYYYNYPTQNQNQNYYYNYPAQSQNQNYYYYNYPNQGYGYYKRSVSTGQNSSAGGEKPKSRWKRHQEMQQYKKA
ncbi:Matrix metalloproteinase-16 [Arthrobotrys musiformis]|uniref:Matrix metalloproteinase-16 n=1 Tax=Arthrobotrys musiformis TaxID=47236 RepID=A0AAV9WML9_9PEZI